MDEQDIRILKDLADRHAIADCIQRYARGIDRLDQDIFLSAYHEDAMDYRGPLTGSPREIMEHLWPLQDVRVTCQHYLTNQTIDIDPDGTTAHTETYFISINREVGQTAVKVVGGRYVDKLEKRDGDWRISVRVLMAEWHMNADGWPIEREYARRDPSDYSYARPLTGRRES